MGNFFSAAPKEAPRCTYTTSRRCVGERQSGGPFWEVFCITYSYANAKCSLEICQKGIAKRVHNLCFTVLDKDMNWRHNNEVVVDAEVVVTARGNNHNNFICDSRLEVRNCNLAPHKGILENWSHSFNSVEAIRYFTPTRHGMFSLTTPLPFTLNNIPTSAGTITHHFATQDAHDACFCVEVKFKMDGAKGLRVHVDGPKLRPNINFTDQIEVEVQPQAQGEAVIRTSINNEQASHAGHHCNRLILPQLLNMIESGSATNTQPPPDRNSYQYGAPNTNTGIFNSSTAMVNFNGSIMYKQNTGISIIK
ncbi:uncharacterized protein G2W53_005846 [Senna tora]|uniref:Uncharacterized protein n=1 Tax=Senna tora TaxID=362788 RepID=A0A834X3T7_9FABA|nr:uncharacterized protein G2W53_005846 [Senna tora]